MSSRVDPQLLAMLAIGAVVVVGGWYVVSSARAASASVVDSVGRLGADAGAVIGDARQWVGDSLDAASVWASDVYAGVADNAQAAYRTASAVSNRMASVNVATAPAVGVISGTWSLYDKIAAWATGAQGRGASGSW